MKRTSVSAILLAGVFSFVTSTSLLAAEYVELQFLKSMQLSPDGSDMRGVDLELSSNVVFWAHGGGIIALDMTHPDSPLTIGSFSLGVTDTAFSDGRLYALCGQYMEVIDAHNPAQLTSLGRFETNVYLTKVNVMGQHAIVLSETNVLVLNVSDPANIRTVATIPDNLEVMALEGTYAYGYQFSSSVMGGGVLDPEIVVYDFTTPGTPKTIGRVPLPFGGVMSACVQNGIGYFGYGAGRLNWWGGCHMVDLRDPVNPVLLGAFSASCFVTSIAVVDGLAFLTPHHSIAVYDIRDPQQTELVGYSQFSSSRTTHEARLNGNHWFVGHETGFEIYRITIPYITCHYIANGRLNLGWHEMAKGMKLQRTTSLINPDWQDLLGSERTNFVSLPIWGGSEFFRLKKP